MESQTLQQLMHACVCVCVCVCNLVLDIYINIYISICSLIHVSKNISIISFYMVSIYVLA